MKSWSLIGLLLLVPLSADAGETVFAKYAGEFLSLGVGGRALAMGGATVALANDVTAGYWNPAALTRIDYPEIILMHDEQFAGLVNNDYGAVAIPFGPDASLGLSIMRVGVDNIPNTQNAGIDANGNPITDPSQYVNMVRVDPSRVTYFSAADWAFYLSYARRESAQMSSSSGACWGPTERRGSVSTSPAGIPRSSGGSSGPTSRT
jgi:hypothetical protein